MNFSPNQPHNLKLLPPKVEFDATSILKALNSASREIGELKGYCTSIPDARVLMSVAITKESVESSSIEEIHTTVESVLKSQVIPASEQKNPDRETLRYLEAINWAMQNIDDFSLSTRLVLGIHERLMQNKVGYRKLQNGIQNKKTGEITYTPPIASRLGEFIQNWENFVNKADDLKIDPLIRCAIAHYQFEAIHPFGDGNGRTGRILLVLQLVQEGLLDFPVLYTSAYFNRNRPQYYQTLQRVTETGDWEAYILFVLEGFRSEAIKTKDKIFQMKNLYQDLTEIIRKNHSKMNAIETVNHVFSFPFTTPTQFATALKVHIQTASKHLAELKKAGIMGDLRMGRHHLYYSVELFEMIKA
jgi:Fic family protein